MLRNKVRKKAEMDPKNGSEKAEMDFLKIQRYLIWAVCMYPARAK